MTDYYLEDRSRLNGQPKRTIGDYVESQGILVPRRFDNLVDARKSNKAVLLRSEHSQEYDGAGRHLVLAVALSSIGPRASASA